MGKVTLSGIKHRLKTVVTGTVIRLGIAPEPSTFGAAPKRSAGFAPWLKRRQQMVGSDLARGWQLAQPQRPMSARVAVVVHLAPSAPQVQPVVEMLSSIPVPFDLFVTNSTGSKVDVDTSSLQNLGNVSVFEAPDQGRDLLPLVTLVNADLLEPYELVLKLNSEAEGTDLVQSVERVSSILAAFADDPSLGILGPASAIRGAEAWGENRELVEAVMQRLQLGLEGRDLRFVAGHTYWIRGFILQGLRSLQISEWDFESEFGQLDGTMAHALERVLGLVADEAGFDVTATDLIGSLAVRKSWGRFMPDSQRTPRARVLALYSTDFHSSESDAGWAPAGQMLWAELAATRPLFRGQSQPLLPSQLGFYDAREPDVLAAQFTLASEAGLEGFAFNYFWHEGEARDTEPLVAHLAGDNMNPFCLVWRNGLSPLRADGESEQISVGSALGFFDDVVDILKDPRYFKIGGKPVLVVGSLDLLENQESVIAEWRAKASKEGLSGITLLILDEGLRPEVALESQNHDGTDGAVTVPARGDFLAAISKNVVSLGQRFHGTARRYDLLANYNQRQLFGLQSLKTYPLIPVAFDNTPEKRAFADILIGSNPFTFHRWLNGAVLSVAERERDERVILIHGWNDWRVSAVLEPSDRFGKTFLLAVRDALWR